LAAPALGHETRGAFRIPIINEEIPNMKAIVCGMALASFALAANAQDTMTERTLTLSLANEIAAAAVASCTASGYNVAAAVVDRSGYLKVLMRADNARPHAIEIAERKAHTSAMLQYETAKLNENIQKGATPASLLNTPKFTSLIGGFPIKVGKETIGGIGVSGAPGGHLDSACVEAAMKKVEDRLK